VEAVKRAWVPAIIVCSGGLRDDELYRADALAINDTPGEVAKARDTPPVGSEVQIAVAARIRRRPSAPLRGSCRGHASLDARPGVQRGRQYLFAGRTAALSGSAGPTGAPAAAR
jgi:hypothetical protein